MSHFTGGKTDGRQFGSSSKVAQLVIGGRLDRSQAWSQYPRRERLVPALRGCGELLSLPYWTSIDGSVVSSDRPRVRVTQDADNIKQSVANDSQWAGSSLLLVSYVLLAHTGFVP